MTGKRGRRDVKAKDAEIKAVHAELDGLLGQVTETAAEIAAILTRPKPPPPEPNVKVVPLE